MNENQTTSGSRLDPTAARATNEAVNAARAMAPLAPDIVEQLRARLHGPLCMPGDPDTSRLAPCAFALREVTG